MSTRKALFPAPTFPLPHPDFTAGQRDASNPLGTRRCAGADPYTWDGHLRTCAYCAGWEWVHVGPMTLQLAEPVRAVVAYWEHGRVP